MDLQLKNKKALVTGSTAGIGYAIAKQLAKENAHVYINGRTTERIETAVKKLKDETGNPNISGFAVDFWDGKQIESLIQQLPDLDVLVNNVGIFEPKPFKEISDADWFKFFEVNVLSGVRLSRAYFDKMIAKNWGRIIFISSESAVQIPGEMIHYGMTKTAQLAVSRGLAELTKGTNVTVNTVLPGPTFSEGAGDFIESLAKDQGKSIKDVEKDFFQYMRPSSLLQRFATPDEIASLVTFVASPLSSATNGAALRADGGVVRSII
ncbi:MAG: family oxidoreductase [Mucilaginibacter sp.]|nr:family oxidoreductase [Mucilaginibacter sp.]